MQVKEVLVLLTDQWADWEAAYAISGINSVPQYTVKTIAVDKEPKVSMGGISAEIDYILTDYHHLDNLAMLILPGGFGWQNKRHDEIAVFVKEIIDSQVPVAAMCGAAIFLGKHGFLDTVKHTGDDLEFFQKEHGYNGQDFYVSAQIVRDNEIITANETAAVEFASTIFELLKVVADEAVDAWHDHFKYGMVR